MNCPICKNISMLEITLQPGLVGNQCPTCRGIWVPSTQYFAWLKQQGPSSHEHPLTGDPLPTNDSERAKLCPGCGHILRHYHVWPDEAFAIDRCNHCNGMWFDRDEWATLEARNLHDDLNQVFAQAWQQKIKYEETRRQMEAIYQGRFGPQDYARLQEIRQWLIEHPQRAALLAFLQADDPYEA